MASALQNSPESQSAGLSHSNATNEAATSAPVAANHPRPQAVRTVGELAARAGLDQEPVVRKWQELIREAVAEQDPERQLQRWDQRRSISALTLMSLLFWGTVVAAAFGLF